jgi:hypothetical protein
MPTFDYTTAANSLTEVESTITQAVQRLRSAKKQIGQAESTLAAIPTQYSSLITWIDDQAAANPDDEAIQDLKRRKDKIAGDFNNRNTTATDMQNALSSYDP